MPRVWIRDLPAPLTYCLFGMLLGMGFLTGAPFAAFTALLAFEIATRSPMTGALVGGVYGVGRSLGTTVGKAKPAQRGESRLPQARGGPRSPLPLREMGWG